MDDDKMFNTTTHTQKHKKIAITTQDTVTCMKVLIPNLSYNEKQELPQWKQGK